MTGASDEGKNVPKRSFDQSIVQHADEHVMQHLCRGMHEHDALSVTGNQGSRRQQGLHIASAECE